MIKTGANLESAMMSWTYFNNDFRCFFTALFCQYHYSNEGLIRGSKTQWSFHKTGTAGTLASQAESDVWVKEPKRLHSRERPLAVLGVGERGSRHKI